MGCRDTALLSIPPVFCALYHGQWCVGVLWCPRELSEVRHLSDPEFWTDWAIDATSASVGRLSEPQPAGCAPGLSVWKYEVGQGHLALGVAWLS